MSEMRQGGRGWPAWVREWVLPYADDIALWPVLFALLGHVVVVIVPLMLQVYRYGSVWAMVLLTMIVVGSLSLVRMEHRATGRFGNLTGAFVLTWVVSFPFAWFSQQTGVL